MGILLKIISVAKSLGNFIKRQKAKTIFVFAAMGIVAFALCSRQVAIKKYEDEKAKNEQAELKHDIKQAEKDTIWLTERVIDTLWVARVRIDTTAGKIDTFSVPCPEERGYIGIDTTAKYGSADNELSVQVEGRAYYPSSNPNRPWLRIVPEIGRLKPYGSGSVRDNAIGLVIMDALNPDDFSATAVAYMRISRLNLMVGYNSKKIWSIGIGYEILRFGKKR